MNKIIGALSIALPEFTMVSSDGNNYCTPGSGVDNNCRPGTNENFG